MKLRNYSVSANTPETILRACVRSLEAEPTPRNQVMCVTFEHTSKMQQLIGLNELAKRPDRGEDTLILF